jgi:16S rRNA C967 or C1407 C5-methylase (RsmB/RsmF family)/NOL1/NOP2/fmu family ribosome biogenesis protein
VQLPQQLLESIQKTTGFDKEAFEKVHASGNQVTSVRLNPSKPVFQLTNQPPDCYRDNQLTRVPWTNFGYFLESRPSFTFDPLFHAGCYYVQEASSMFLEQALKQTVDLSKPLKILDLCAAPGGKSTHIQSLISKDSLLVSNEVIRSRANILKDNIIKWSCSNVMVTNNDPRDFARLENYFDVIVVDAPCSGSGLFRRDPDAINEWREENVQLCSQRQQRILADVWPTLKKDGILVYSTCSYSMEEDEKIVEWLQANYPLSIKSLSIQPEWGIIESGIAFGKSSATAGGGYRFWPYKLKGEGFFLSCFKKKEGEVFSGNKSKSSLSTLTNKEVSIAAGWINTDGLCLQKNGNTVYAWPEKLKDDFSFLREKLRIIYSGVEAGELIRDKFIPSHALALSHCLKDSLHRIELTYDDAIRYLKKKDMDNEISQKGWQVVTYRGQPLGWVNVLPGRINNYYLKELRILKDG